MAANNTISISFKISDDANGLKQLTMDAAQLRKVMEENVKVAQEMQSKFFKFAAVASSVNAVINSFKQLSDSLNNLTAESQKFEKSMRAANTMAGKDSGGFAQLKGEVAELGKEIPLVRDQLANGLYQTISNGVPENNWIDFLNTNVQTHSHIITHN